MAAIRSPVRGFPCRRFGCRPTGITATAGRPPSPTAAWPAAKTQIANARATFGQITALATPVAFPAAFGLADVTKNGTSNTYLLGEKYLDPDNYANGQDMGDNENALMGDNEDICRWSSQSNLLNGGGEPVQPYPPAKPDLRAT